MNKKHLFLLVTCFALLAGVTLSSQKISHEAIIEDGPPPMIISAF